MRKLNLTEAGSSVQSHADSEGRNWARNCSVSLWSTPQPQLPIYNVRSWNGTLMIPAAFLEPNSAWLLEGTQQVFVE